MAKTIYKVEGGSSGSAPVERESLDGDSPLEVGPAAGSSSGRRDLPRGKLLWILVGIGVLTVVMIAVIAVLGVAESPAEGTSVAPETFSTVTTVAVTSTVPVPTSVVAAMPLSSTTTEPATTTSTAATTTTLLSHPLADPARLVIPAISVDAEIVAVGTKNNVAMEIPPVGLVGWYKLGAAPGASGPAVLVSHVSWNGKKGVFYKLKDLEVGDEFTVYGKSGDSATFVVDATETTLKSDLPTEKIWNQTTDAVIRLITCGGRYDSRTGHYLSNIIVYGHLVK